MDKNNIISLYEKKLAEINTVALNYYDFLSMAGRLPNFDFANQLIIFAQKPFARACYDMETWNCKFKCLVPERAQPIYILCEEELPKVVYDISDIGVFPHLSKPLPKLNLNISDYKKHFATLMLEFMNEYDIPEEPQNFELDIQNFAFLLTREKVLRFALDVEQERDICNIVCIAITKIVLGTFNVTSRYDVPMALFDLSSFDRNTVVAIGELVNATSLEIIKVLEHSIKSDEQEVVIVE